MPHGSRRESHRGGHYACRARASRRAIPRATASATPGTTQGRGQALERPRLRSQPRGLPEVQACRLAALRPRSATCSAGPARGAATGSRKPKAARGSPRLSDTPAFPLVHNCLRLHRGNACGGGRWVVAGSPGRSRSSGATVSATASSTTRACVPYRARPQSLAGAPIPVRASSSFPPRWLRRCVFGSLPCCPGSLDQRDAGDLVRVQARERLGDQAAERVAGQHVRRPDPGTVQ